MNRHTIIYSRYRTNALRTPSRLRAGYLPRLSQWMGRYDFSRLKTSPWLPHVGVGNRVISHSLDVFLNAYTYYLQSFFSHAQYQKRYKLINPLLFFLALIRFVEFCHTRCLCINVARLSVFIWYNYTCS